MAKNADLEMARIEMERVLKEHRAKMRVFVVRNKLAGVTDAALRKMERDPTSKWNLEWEALNKALKKRVAGLVNNVFRRAYQGGL